MNFRPGVSDFVRQVTLSRKRNANPARGSRSYFDFAHLLPQFSAEKTNRKSEAISRGHSKILCRQHAVQEPLAGSEVDSKIIGDRSANVRQRRSRSQIHTSLRFPSVND